MLQLDPRAMARHVPLVGWAFVAASLLYVPLALLIFALLAALGFATADPRNSALMGFFVAYVGFFLLLLFVPGLIAGYGLLKRLRWARRLGIVVATVELTNVPVGTALGLYALWVLSQREAAAYFAPPPEGQNPRFGVDRGR